MIRKLYDCIVAPLRRFADLTIQRFNGLIPFPDNNRHLFQTVGPRCLVALKQSEGGCAAIIPGGAAAPPYPLHRLSLGIGITRSQFNKKAARYGRVAFMFLK